MTIELQKPLELKNFQYDFIFSRAQFPAMISAWGTGKTMCGIQRGLFYSQEIPNNLGVIFRKTYKDLSDSTLRDFELYTGLKVDANRNVSLPNKSTIMFRHLEELNNIQNMNLGWFLIEQGEEMPTDNEFYMLWGRLRRQATPSDYFRKIGWPQHSGFVIGNVAGDNWIKRIWKDNPKPDYDLIEATTFDMEGILSPDFIKNMRQLETEKPTLYKRFVLNDWTAEVEGRVFNNIHNCVAGDFEESKAGFDYILGVDLAKSQDFTVITVICRQTKHVVCFKRLESDNKTSWNEQKEQIKAIALKYNNALVVIDASGPGDPIAEDLLRSGVGVWFQPHKNKDSTPGVKFTNIVKEDMVERLKVAIENRLITFPDIQVMIDELNNFECQMTASRRYRYQAPEGKHDDCVISLALAVWALLGSMYEVYTEPKPVTSADLFWARVKKDTSRYNQMVATEEQISEIEEEGVVNV